MNINKTEIKKGINLHTIKTDKFKSNIVSVFLTTTLTKQDVTKNALISLILRRGTNNIKTQAELGIKLEEMYGGLFNSGLDKIGDNHLFKFYLETINDEFLPEHKENVLDESISLLLDIVFNPLTEEGRFKQEYFEQEKVTLQKLIAARKDNKRMYALNRCIEEMYKGTPYGLYKLGSEEDISKLENKDLYAYYKELIRNVRIDIFVSGDIKEDEVMTAIEENSNIKNLPEREPSYTPVELKINETNGEEKEVQETMEVSQGNLTIGLDVGAQNQDDIYKSVVYNAILGGSANSKLFQNVREKAHLAYVASSSYLRHKHDIIISCGIEIGNYDKALKIIREQIDDIKNENFTDKDLEEAKKMIIEDLKVIDDEQDSQITYCFGQEIQNVSGVTPEEYMEGINHVTKQDVLDIAKRVKINTIYFLKGESE